MLRVLDDFGTGYQHTTVLRTPDSDFLWIRRPGHDRPSPARVDDPALNSAISAISDAGDTVLPVSPGPTTASGQTWREYRVTGPHSLARSYLQPETDTSSVAEETLAGAGRFLARLHGIAVPGRVRLPTPDGPARMLRWLGGGTGPRGARRLHEDACALLGTDRLRRAREWCAELREIRPGADGAVLLHGAPGNGVLIPSVPEERDRVSAVMLVGEELSLGPREFDLGWLAGELVEYRDLPEYTGQHTVEPLDYQHLIDVLLDGYGPGPDLERLDRCAILRVFIHVHDYCSYVGWHETAGAYLRAIADMMDAAEHGGLLSGARGVVV